MLNTYLTNKRDTMLTSILVFQQHLSEINDPLVEQAILDNIEDVYYKDDSFDSSLHELQVKFTKSEIQT